MSDFHTDDTCLFCKIIAGVIPGDVVAETERLLAIRDIAPKAPVHVLVLPRDHQPNAAATAAATPGLIDEMVTLADRISKEAGHPAYNLLFNTGAEAGQTIFHAHLHLLAGGRLSELPV